MGFGNSLLLSMNGASRIISCSSDTVNAVPAVSQQGNQCRPVSRLAGCRNFLRGAPSLESRVPRTASRKRGLVIQAAESRSVDTPESPASSSKSNGSGSQAQSHLDLLHRMTENSSASQDVKTIRDQLSSQAEAPEAAVVALANGEKEQPVPELTISQRRNIRRQNYLNKVSERNDAPFFATVAAFVVVPPVVILAVAVATGYVELFP